MVYCVSNTNSTLGTTGTCMSTIITKHYIIMTLQVVPLPLTECDALRQAFLDHGQSVGIQLNEVPRDTPISEVSTCRAFWRVI